MPTPAQIVDGRGTKSRVKVTRNGQLVVAALAYDETESNNLAELDTAYNFYGPQVGNQFVITGIIAKADKEVDSSIPAVVIVYEASASNTLTVDKTLFQVSLIELEGVILLPLNILVNAGKYINTKTSDDDVDVTITGYYIPEL